MIQEIIFEWGKSTFNSEDELFELLKAFKSIKSDLRFERVLIHFENLKIRKKEDIFARVSKFIKNEFPSKWKCLRLLENDCLEINIS